MQVCTNCGAEVSPAGSCANCGASLRGGLQKSHMFRNDSFVTVGRLVERSTDLDRLSLEKKKRYKVMAWMVAAGVVLIPLGFMIDLPGLGIMALALALMIGGGYVGAADMDLRRAQGREAKRIQIMISENRICAQCYTVLFPNASCCSSCGGEDLRIAAQGLNPDKTAGKTTVETAAHTAGAAVGWAVGLIRGAAKH